MNEADRIERPRRTAPATGAARGFTVVQLAAALGLISVLALAPAGVARFVHSRRIAAGQAQVERTALRLRQLAADRFQTTSSSRGVHVFAGPGATPVAPGASDWLDARIDSLAAMLPGFEVRPDPWGNHLLVNAVDGGDAIWVLSAGPNGMIETPMRQRAASAALSGDDIGARVR